MVQGTITVAVGEESFEAPAGSFVFLPRNIPHAWDVVGESATLLMMTVPAMLEEFLRELHTAEDRAQVADKYGIRFL